MLFNFQKLGMLQNIDKPQKREFKNNDSLYSFNESIPKRLRWRSSLLSSCVSKYPNCFWLENQRTFQKLSNLIKYLEQIKLQHFIFIRTSVSCLSVLSEIKFSKLKILCLDQNKIESIQMLCSFYLPQVRQISLRNNCITEAKSLRKIVRNSDQRHINQEREMPINKIALDGNKIISISFLSECNFHLEKMFLDVATYDSPCGIDLRPLVKTKFAKNAQLYIDSIFRLEQRQFLEQFEIKNMN